MAVSTVRPSSSLQHRDEIEHLLLRSHVQRARRLVEDDEARLLRERPREHGALTLAAAQ